MDAQRRQAVHRMLSYIQNHLDSEVTLLQIAHAGGYSPYHADRIFKEETGSSLFAYLRKSRLATAADILAKTDRTILDVALQFVFDSHEGFTRAFSKQFGMSPSAFRKALRTYHTYVDTQHTKEGTQDMQTVFVQVIQRPMRKVIVKYAQKATDYFTYCEEVGCAVWDVLASIPEALYEPIGMWMPPSLRKLGVGIYMQGVEVPMGYDKPVTDGFSLITLPPCSLMVFQGPPFEDAAFSGAIQDVWEVMEHYDPTLYGYRWADEDGPRFQLCPLGYRGYIEARPVRALEGKPQVASS
ncbi:AraC family transcriptional regulator [Sphaerochaeta sp.]|uniref:AraC family transcriptional regulator n=1 Tax=Sphaerochaeta sp. TaxID=1972642 RepID=UPI002FC5C64D